MATSAKRGRLLRGWPVRSWPVRLVLAGLALVLLLRVAGGLLLGSFVAWQAEKRNWQLVEGVILGSPALFGRAALPALEWLFEERPRFKAEAYSAIARLSTARASRLLAEGTAASPAGSWWRPPTPPRELLELYDLEPPAVEGSREDLSWTWRWQLRNSCLGADVDGAPLLVFSHGYLGGARDLWLVRPEAPTPEPLFLGAPLGREHDRTDLDLRCTLLEGDTLELVWSPSGEPDWPPRPPPPPLLLRLPEATADSDGDGLTDLVEGRLRLDPRARDSDGDGVEDGEDWSPNGGLEPRPESVDEATNELLRTWFGLGEQSCRWGTVLYLVSDRRPERWAHHCGPTINLPADVVDEQPYGMTVLVIEPYNARWGRFGSMSIAPGSFGNLIEALTRPEATRLLVVNDHIGSDSEGYEVQLRRRDGGWHLIWFKNLWF